MASKDDAESEPRPGWTETSEPEGVDVVDRTGRIDAFTRAWLASHVGRALTILGREGSVRIGLVGDDEMAAAHRRHLGQIGPTDVLTFDMTDGESASGSRAMDLDILVCVDEAARRAAELGHDVRREMLLYMIHAIHHALGHDDHTESGARDMHDAEDALLEHLGVGATYAPRRPAVAPAGGGQP